MSIDTAVVLAAGEGRRLRPLTRHRPKPMLPAANRPILEHVFDALIDAGVTDLHVVVGYRRDRVQDHFGATYREVPVHYHTQDKQLGSGHALLQAADTVEGTVLVVNGDEIASAETVRGVIDTHESDAVATLGVVESELAPRYGAVRLSGAEVTEYVESPGTDEYRLLNAGIYVFDERVLAAVENTPRREGELSLADTLSRIVGGETDLEGRVLAARADEPWVHATFPWDLLSVARHLIDRGRVAGSEREAGVYVADSADVHESAVLQAPVVVSGDCVVGPNAVVGPDTALGRNATVGANATVRGSVVDADTRVDAGATLVDCVTGRGVRVREGATAVGGPSDVRIGTEIHEDRRLGAVLADRVEVGGGATLAAGTLVGPDAAVGSGAFVQGLVGEGAEVIR